MEQHLQRNQILRFTFRNITEETKSAIIINSAAAATIKKSSATKANNSGIFLGFFYEKIIIYKENKERYKKYIHKKIDYQTTKFGGTRCISRVSSRFISA